MKLSEAKKSFVLLPKRWMVERSFGWAALFKHPSKDYELLVSTLTGLRNPHALVIFNKNHNRLLTHNYTTGLIIGFKSLIHVGRSLNLRCITFYIIS